MPNWCHDRLVVSGEPSKVKAFVMKVQTTPNEAGEFAPLTFAAHVPRPADQEGNWYQWNVDNWGTKWDANFGSPFMALGGEDMRVKDPTEYGWQPVDNGLQIEFETAWAPPIAWLVQTGSQEPELVLTLTFAEPGMGEAGRVTLRNGKATTESLEVEDVLQPDEMWF